MNPERRAIADEIYALGREFDAQQSNRLARLRNLEPATAQLLAVLIRAAGARRILEVGTSNGYSTLWLTDAAGITGGHVESLDIDPRRSDQACDNIARAGLDGLATCRTVSAAQALTEYPDDAWDLIFLDAERPEYVSYWPNVRRTLAAGGTLAIDNAISHAAELSDVNRLLADDPRLTTVLVPIGDGLLVSVEGDG
ncbi:MAG: class I SAM-dependent methyltransferase [Solirubrobacteraceae bacterium]|jgi:predicted O-methyltransferase YrrM